MPKKKFHVVFEEEFHKKLRKYADEGEVTLGDAIGILCQHAEARVDLARLHKSLPYQDELPKQKGKFDSMLYHALNFTMQDQAEIYRTEDEKGLKKTPRPFFPFFGKPLV